MEAFFAIASVFGRYEPGLSKNKVVVRNVTTETIAPTTRGKTPDKLEMNGTTKPEPTEAVTAIMLTEPRLCGGTRSSEIR